MHKLTQAETMRVFRVATPIAVVCMAVLAVLYTIYFAAELLSPIFIAIFLSMILQPLVRNLGRLGLPQALSALIVLLVLLCLVAGGGMYLSGPASAWVERLPYIQRDLESKFRPVKKSIERAKRTTEKIQKLAEPDEETARPTEVALSGPSLLERIFAFTWFTVVQAFITLVLTFFLLSASNDRTRQSLQKLPWRDRYASIDSMFESAGRAITRFLRVSAAVYATVGALTALAMFLLDMPNPILWGGLAMVLGFIQYIGPVVVFVCIGIASALTFDGWWQIAAPPMVYGALTVIEGYFVTPTILGRHMTLNPIAIFLSMLLWTWMWGVVGAFLAVPILVVASVFARHIALMVRESENASEHSESETGAANELPS